MEYTIGTYNIWNPVKSPRLVDALDEAHQAGFHLLGLQEVENARVRAVIRSWVRKNHMGLIRGGTPIPVIYDPRVFLLRKSEPILFAHASKNPRHPDRLAVKVNLTHKASGRKIRVFNTHIEHSYAGSNGERARIAKLQLTGIEKRAANAVEHNPDMIVNVMGDMNLNSKVVSKSWYPGRIFADTLPHDVHNGLDHIYSNIKIHKLPVIPLTSDHHNLVRARVIW